MKKKYLFFASLILFSHIISTSLIAQSPPLGGTIFLDPDIITPDDPTTFVKLEAAGRGSRTMFDRRVNDWISRNVYLFNASFDDGLSTEIQVNPEFGSVDAALVEAEKYAPFIGQLPTALRKDAETIWIHKGVNPFGGGNRNILIHTGQADLYVRDGILEETLMHEATHTSLDGPYASSSDWKVAQTGDPTFISTYARDFPNREDMAESFLLYFAFLYRPDRIDKNLKNTIIETMPNRIAYFDGLMLDMHPVLSTTTSIQNEALAGLKLSSQPNPFQEQTIISYNLQQSKVVSLTLYNLQGQPIEQLLPPTKQSEGTHEITLAADQRAKGLYFIQLQSGEITLLHKIFLF